MRVFQHFCDSIFLGSTFTHFCPSRPFRRHHLRWCICLWHRFRYWCHQVLGSLEQGCTFVLLHRKRVANNSLTLETMEGYPPQICRRVIEHSVEFIPLDTIEVRHPTNQLFVPTTRTIIDSPPFFYLSSCFEEGLRCDVDVSYSAHHAVGLISTVGDIHRLRRVTE